MFDFLENAEIAKEKKKAKKKRIWERIEIANRTKSFKKIRR